jgi:hypothetical protein
MKKNDFKFWAKFDNLKKTCTERNIFEELKFKNKNKNIVKQEKCSRHKQFIKKIKLTY